MKIVFVTSDHGFADPEMRQFEDAVQKARDTFKPKSVVTMQTHQTGVYNATSKRVETRITLIAIVERG